MDIEGTDRGPFGDPPHWGDRDRLESKGNQPRAAHEWCQLNEGPPSSNCLFFDQIGPQKDIRCRDPSAARPVYGLVSRLLYSHNFRDLPVKLHAVESAREMPDSSIKIRSFYSFFFLFSFFFLLLAANILSSFAFSSKREGEREREENSIEFTFRFLFAVSISRLFARVNTWTKFEREEQDFSFFFFFFS